MPGVYPSDCICINLNLGCQVLYRVLTPGFSLLMNFFFLVDNVNTGGDVNIAIRKFRVVILMSNSCHSLPGWSCSVGLTSPQTNFFRCRSLIFGAWVLGHMKTEKLWRLLILALHSLCDLLNDYCIGIYGGWSPTSGHPSLCGCLACFDFRTRFGFCRSRSWVCRR